ncbi:MAG: hypothetical protein QG666_943 [Euryarchaeota archaeon]|nr:hypothetical protein [Euryarchaeota archaeon]
MRVELKVDGKDVDLNAFTQEIIGNAAAAMAESLHGVGADWKGIEIKIEK